MGISTAPSLGAKPRQRRLRRYGHSLVKAALGIAMAVAGCLPVAHASDQQIVVSNYAVAANGMPYAVAMAKGFSLRQARRSRALCPRQAGAPPSAI